MSDRSESARSRRGAERVHSSFSESAPSEEYYSNGITIQCQFCPAQGFRRSSLRVQDLQDLFFMRYPVRCLRCGQRQAVSFTVASVSVPSHVKQRRHRRSVEKSADWSLVAPGAETAGTKEGHDPEDAPKGEL